MGDPKWRGGNDMGALAQGESAAVGADLTEWV